MTGQARGRRPYGVQVIDGTVRLDPTNGPTLQRIFDEYAAGRPLRSIANDLTAAASPTPGRAGQQRVEEQRTWSKSMVRAILVNPRYRTDYSAVLPDNILRLVDERFEHLTSPADVADWGASRYALRGLLRCGLCRRLMQGTWNNSQSYYRCRQMGPGDGNHPRTVYLRESAAIGALVGWMSGASLGSGQIRIALRDGDASQRAAVLRALGTKLTFEPHGHVLRVRALLGGEHQVQAGLFV